MFTETVAAAIKEDFLMAANVLIEQDLRRHKDNNPKEQRHTYIEFIVRTVMQLMLIKSIKN